MTARTVIVALCLLRASSVSAQYIQEESSSPPPSPAPQQGPASWEEVTGAPEGAEPEYAQDPAAAASDADAPPPAAPQAPTESVVSADVSVGAGIGARSMTIPSRRSDRRLSTGVFPSVTVGLHGEIVLHQLLLGAAATYNTAVGLQAASIMPAAGNDVDGAQLRSNSLTLGLVPGYRFGESADSISLRVFVGWGFRSLHTVVDLETPSYSLHGPTLRPELTLPLNHGLIVVRLAPELQVIAGASRALASLSDSSLPGVALGGEASLQVRIIPELCAALAYRESYAMVSTSWGSYIRDSERFVTLQLAWHRQ